MTGSRRAGRILAFQALYSYEACAQPLEQLLGFPWLDKEAPGERVTVPSRDFARLLTAGTIENLEEVDYACQKLGHGLGMVCY